MLTSPLVRPVLCVDFERADALSVFEPVMATAASHAHDGGVWVLSMPATSNAAAQVAAKVRFAGRSERVRVVELDVFIESLQAQQAIPFALLEPNVGYSELVFRSDVTYVCNANDVDAGGECTYTPMPPTPLPLREWLRLKTTLDFNTGRATLVTSFVDGGAVLPQCSIADAGLSRVGAPAEPYLWFGIMFPGVPTTGEIRYRLDNLVFDLR